LLAGVNTAAEVFRLLDPDAVFTIRCRDGDTVVAGELLLSVEAKMRALLTGERTALNLLQRMSGIATHVRRYADIVGDRPIRLVDTRKTTPGLRILEKYAVRTGGAHNHRFGLFDGVLIKDNHITACGGIRPAIERIRAKVSHLVRIEVEVADQDQVGEALAAGADVIMLDNMDLPAIHAAVAAIEGKALVEVSGNVTTENLENLCRAGVDIISSGALTHSARSVDISMRIEAQTSA
jgi:nicotinate-nucleotide pyrophosphorylase (carboxylating)